MRGKESSPSVEVTLSRGKRDRDLESAHTLSERRKSPCPPLEKAVKSIEISNLRDWRFIRRINGPIRLKEKILIYLEKWTCETESSKTIVQDIAKK